MAVDANSNIFSQDFLDFIPVSGENCRDFIHIKPRLAGYHGILPLNRSRPARSPENGAGDDFQQQIVHGKRSRDSFDLYNPSPVFVSGKNSNHGFSQFHSVVGGGDVLPIFQQYQSEIDRIVCHHEKKLRVEFEEREKHSARNLMAAIGEGLMKKLREKDEEIQRMGKLNLALQERVKSLYAENQLWREMAQTNEAAANSLRSNLEQVLAHVANDTAAGEEDAESCCGSTDQGGPEVEICTAEPPRDDGGRLCRRCGERESSVLLLPCRHLCLCTVCGSTLVRNCPVCNSNMNATLHVSRGIELRISPF